jgi:hypothetical protein
MKQFFFVLLFLFSVFACSLSAQTDTTLRKINLPAYYNDRIHFGFYMGISGSNYKIKTDDNWRNTYCDSLRSITSSFQPGFNFGVISELKICKFGTLRFLPDIAFIERNLEYHFETSHDTFTIGKNAEFTYVDFPIDFKLLSRRFGNFATYLTLGGRYSLDLASKKDLPANQQIIGFAKSDYGWEAGTGIDFFLPYFKFGIDLKYSPGFKNLLIKDGTIFSQTIDRLQSQVFLISFTFEG